MSGLLDTGAVLSVISIETWRSMGFNKDDLIDSRIRLSVTNKGTLRVIGRRTQFVDELSGGGEPR